VEIDNEAKDAKPAKSSAKKAGKKKGDKKPKIPNFEKFRLKLFLIIAGVIALIALWYVAVFVMPSAKVTITADTEDITANLEFTASPTVTSVNAVRATLPAEQVETDKEDTQKTAA